MIEMALQYQGTPDRAQRFASPKSTQRRLDAWAEASKRRSHAVNVFLAPQYQSHLLDRLAQILR